MFAIGICTDFVNLPDAAALGYDYVELSLADLPPPLTHSIRNMQAELSHNFSIPELAAMSNTSKATLNRLFRKYLNTSPQAYNPGTRRLSIV